jgi:hypothetical protein
MRADDEAGNGTGRYRSPHQRMPFSSRSEGLNAFDDLASTIHQSLGVGGGGARGGGSGVGGGRRGPGAGGWVPEDGLEFGDVGGLAPGGGQGRGEEGGGAGVGGIGGRGFHSSTYQLNLSRFRH